MFINSDSITKYINLFYDAKQHLFVCICKTKLQKNCALISIDDATTICIFVGINTNEHKINYNDLIKKLLNNNEQWAIDKNGFGTIENLEI